MDWGRYFPCSRCAVMASLEPASPAAVTLVGDERPRFAQMSVLFPGRLEQALLQEVAQGRDLA